MRICIYGAGAVGGYLAARLARAGKDVSLIARGQHLQAIKSEGLRLETPEESFTVHPQASDDPTQIGPQDVVILTVKTPALPAAAQALAPMLTDTTRIVFAVNGVFWFYGHDFAPGDVTPDTSRLDPGAALQRLIGAERALGMVIYSPNTVPQPGLVRNSQTSGNRFILGSARRGETESAQAVADAMAGAGLETPVTPDIRQAMWKKLTLNVGSSPICCLTGQGARTALNDPVLRDVETKLIAETLAIAAAHGFDLGPPAQQPSAAQASIDHKPSMLQDLERGRPMEIDSQLRILQDFGRQLELPTPTLDMILSLLILRAQAAGTYAASAA